MTTAEKRRFLVRHPVISYYLMSCAFFWTLLILFGGIVAGAPHVDLSARPWAVWLVTIIASWTTSLSAVIVVRSTQWQKAVTDLFTKRMRFKPLARLASAQGCRSLVGWRFRARRSDCVGNSSQTACRIHRCNVMI